MISKAEQANNAEKGIITYYTRWHNHLEPSINKNSWNEGEEAILLVKNKLYGNKWSEIANYLPGRSDNCIKNHFYSKLRKFIRKILKQLKKDGKLLKFQGNFNESKFNSEKIYRLIRKLKIPYVSLSMESVSDLIRKKENGFDFLEENITNRSKFFIKIRTPKEL